MKFGETFILLALLQDRGTDKPQKKIKKKNKKNEKKFRTHIGHFFFQSKRAKPMYIWIFSGKFHLTVQFLPLEIKYENYENAGLFAVLTAHVGPELLPGLACVRQAWLK